MTFAQISMKETSRQIIFAQCNNNDIKKNALHYKLIFISWNKMHASIEQFHQCYIKLNIKITICVKT